MNFAEQFDRMEMDTAWDNYLDECRVLNITPMPFGMWKESYMLSK